MNGKFALIGNQANEGFAFVPNPALLTPLFPLAINSSANLEAYIAYIFPLFPPHVVRKVMAIYSPSLAQNFTNFDANEASVFGELASNIVGESVFYCPSRWMAQAMSRSYRYQFSIPPALHASDLATYIPDFVSADGPGQLVTEDFRRAFLQGWINFVLGSDPSNKFLGSGSVKPNGTWPVYTEESSLMVNFNVSGGTPQDTFNLGGFNISQLVGGEDAFGLIDELSWQAGRGTRCDFWRSLGGVVPV